MPTDCSGAKGNEGRELTGQLGRTGAKQAFVSSDYEVAVCGIREVKW